MEELAGHGLRNCTVGTDEPEIKAESLRDGHRERVTASRDQNDLDTGVMRVPQRAEIRCGNLELGVQQRAIDVDGDKANGSFHWIDFTSRSRDRLRC